MQKIKLCAVLASFSLGLPVWAAEDGKWKGSAELGAIVTSGNSETSTINGKLAGQYQTGVWTHSAEASASQAAEDGDTTAERYSAKLRAQGQFSELNYAFGAVEYDKDLFGGVRESVSETVGVGRRVWQGDATFLDAEIGAGARQQEPQGGGQRAEEFIGRAGLSYGWTISPTSSFAAKAKVESGEDNTASELDTALKLSVTGAIFVKLGVNVKHNSEVPAGTKKTDTVNSLTISYEFGG